MKLLAMYLAIACTLSVHAQGVIWSINRINIGGNGEGAGPLPNRQIGIDHSANPFIPSSPSLNPVSGIFSMIISTNDAGRTFFASALNEPGFVGFVAGLTDGANDFIRISEFTPVPYGYATEANFLGRSPFTPDFAGYNIAQVGFRVNSYYDWYYEPENRYLNTLDYSLDFYGAPVPEPGTWALLTLGGATALLLRRRVGKRGGLP